MTTKYLAYIPSPSQGVWHIGVLPLRAYALFIILGIVAALIIGDRRWVARGGQAGVIYDIALWAVPFGLIGGRLYHVMTDWRTYFGDDGAGLVGALKIWDGGLGIWGAVALGGIGAWIGCRQKGIPLPAFGDAIAPGIILAQAIGRLGNYFNQELYGRPTTLPWGLEIYERRDASGALDTLNGTSTGQLIEVVHPTFLYELLWNLLIFAALIYIDRRIKIGHGRLFAMYVAGYCVGRFWVELMRSDVATHIAGIRINSFTSTFVFIGAVVYIMVAPKGREAPSSLAGKPSRPAPHEDAVETVTKELAAVAATTGVVAAATAASHVEDDDAKSADRDKPQEPPEPESPEEPVAGLGAVDGEEAAEAVAVAPEVHDTEVQQADAAEVVAGKVAAAGDEKPDDADANVQEPEEPEEPEEPHEPHEPGEREEPVAGLGAVDGEEAAEAVAVAPEVHETEVQQADAAGVVADDADEIVHEPHEPEEREEPHEPEEREEPHEPEEREEPHEPEEPEEPVAGLGAVDGEEAVEAVAVAPEVHDTEVQQADAAEVVAGEVAAAGDNRSDDADANVQEPEEPQAPEEPEEPVAGLGAVEGEEAAEAVAVAPEVHDTEVQQADAATAVADEVAVESDDKPAQPEQTSEAESEGGDQPGDQSESVEPEGEAGAEPAAEEEAPTAPAQEEPQAGSTAEADAPAAPEDHDTTDAQAAVGQADPEPTGEESAKQAEAVAEAADTAGDDEPKTGVLDTGQAAPAEPEPASKADDTEGSGRRLSRWLRRNR